MTGVYALGDCASITDPHIEKPYPPTEQHVIKEGRTAANNIIYAVEKREAAKDRRVKFNYKTKWQRLGKVQESQQYLDLEYMAF